MPFVSISHYHDPSPRALTEGRSFVLFWPAACPGMRDIFGRSLLAIVNKVISRIICSRRLCTDHHTVCNCIYCTTIVLRCTTCGFIPYPDLVRDAMRGSGGLSDAYA